MPPRLLAFDLDGTLLTTDKRLSSANRAALADMVRCGSSVALASGRLRSSMMRYAGDLGIDIAMVTLNGAAVYVSASDHAEPVYSLRLPATFSDYLISHSGSGDYVLNYYRDDTLYAVHNARTAPWIDLYVRQTNSQYRYVDSMKEFLGVPPHKIIFVGGIDTLDKAERAYRKLWGDGAYVVRTWDFYLEFLNRDAHKGAGITALAEAFGVELSDVAAFGDSHNDIPMLRAAGHGIAMRNAPDAVKEAATHVSPWTNDEDGVAREWERLREL